MNQFEIRLEKKMPGPGNDKEKENLAERIIYIGQASFMFNAKFEAIIEWLGKGEPDVERNDVLIFKFPGQEKEILKIMVSRAKNLNEPIGIAGLSNLGIDITRKEDREKRFTFDVYKMEKKLPIQKEVEKNRPVA